VEVAAPEKAATLPEVLAAHVKNNANRPHIWLWRSDDEEERITYADLDTSARAIAGGLLERGLQLGERVAIMLPTGLGFFETFLGVVLAGAVPVPIYPPFRRAQIEAHLRTQAGILRNAQATFLVTDAEIHRMGVLLHSLTDSLRSVEMAGELRKSTPFSGSIKSS
jgi:acyl-CoA synthetase (AMP-forming)/AMP-acid ligase II